MALHRSQHHTVNTFGPTSPGENSPESLQLSPSRSFRSKGFRRSRKYPRKRELFTGSLIIVLICTWIWHLTSTLKAIDEAFEEHPPLDVVGLSLKPSCVTRQAIWALNEYLKPPHIHVVTTSQAKCRIFYTFAANVVCHVQDDLIPGLSSAAVGKYIREHLGVDSSRQYSGRELSGWYMQQFIKLGAAQAIPDLTTHFIVWDLDMILLKPVQVLFSSGDTVQTLVNIGGSIAKGYILSYRKLMNRRLEHALDGSSFVTHWMVVYKPYMEEFLQQLSVDGQSTGWVWNILGNVEPANVDLGFSEYASYVSWVKQNHPQSQHILAKKTWVRHPFGQGMVRFLRHLDHHGCCCPNAMLLRLLKLMGFVYTGYEVGHVPACRYNDSRYDVAYGLDAAALAAAGEATVGDATADASGMTAYATQSVGTGDGAASRSIRDTAG